MARRIAFLGLALFAVGCGGNTTGKPATESPTPAGKPSADEATACVVAYLNQCGWKDVKLARLDARDDVPEEARAGSQAWAFTFTAHYTNVIGERQTSANWTVVLCRSGGQPCVQSCFDDQRKLVSGNPAPEPAEKAVLIATAPADDLPPIVAPKP